MKDTLLSSEDDLHIPLTGDNSSTGRKTSYGASTSVSVASAAEDAMLLADEVPLVAANAKSDVYPKSIPFIMVNETCERFCYYGLRAILALYLSGRLNFSDNTATVIVHAFSFGAYASTIFGGYLSDAILGKYHTIFYVSMVYALGCFVLAFTAVPGVTGTPPHWWGAVLGLVLIACGTGGIKPVVSAFVGDQFGPHQAHLLDHIFFLFYFCINLGSTFSTILTPVLRTYVDYWAAFGVPAVLMFMAVITFWLGRHKYRRNPPTGSVLGVSANIVGTAIKKWVKEGKGAKQHWLDLSLGHYATETVHDVRVACGVLFVFLPLPLFWALFDQSSSRWIFQAQRMNRHFWKLNIDADQVPAVAPILVMLCVPLFNYCIYPLLARMKLPLRPLQRMAVGMVIAALSFVCAGMLEWVIDREGEGQVHIMWQLPQYVVITFAEIMISITGLEFSYGEAPKSMKSLIMAGWLMTVAIGNIIVVIVAESHLFPKQWIEFIFFAAMMFLAALLFMAIARQYQYVKRNPESQEEE